MGFHEGSAGGGIPVVSPLAAHTTISMPETGNCSLLRFKSAGFPMGFLWVSKGFHEGSEGFRGVPQASPLPKNSMSGWGKFFPL